MKRFEGQVAIVTGGATGLGFGIAKRLGKEGAIVALFDRDDQRLKQAASELADSGVKAATYQCDVADADSVQNAVTRVQSDHSGAIDIMVNSAGIVGSTATKIVDYDPAEFDRVYAVNLRGSFIMTRAVLPAMLRKNYGRILLIASIAGKDGNPGMCGYSATKAGVIGLTKSVAKEFADTGVTINALAPAVVMTEMVRNAHPDQVKYMTSKIPMGRVGEIEEVAATVAFAVSRECSFTTGFVFDLSGGRAVY